MQRFLVVIGTRPEAIKLAPVVHALSARGAEVAVCLTGQHGDMLHKCLDSLGIVPRYLPCVVPPGAMPWRLGSMTQEVGDYVEHSQAECVIVVGDTLSAMAGALAGAYANVPVAHVEAGLRTHECEPWPEEMTRRAIGSVAHWHFTPTPSGFYNLLREGVDVMRIWNTGNPVVDSLHSLGVTRNKSPQPSVLVTLHRRENWPDIPVLSSLIASLADRHADVQFTWPVHPNPAIEEEARAKCGYLDNIKLPDSLDYGEFMGHLAAAHLVITDSGGVQEEAAVLGVPTLVVRKNTERPEAVKAGVSRLIDSLGLFATADELLKDSAKLAAMEVTTDAFGDGRASERIADILLTGTTTLGEPN